MTMTSSSSSLIDDEKSVSLSEIHSSLVYGFELSWLNGLCEGKCRNCWLDGNRPKCDDRSIGCFIGIYWEHCVTTWIIQLAIVYGVIPFLSLRIIIGIPCVVVFLIYKHKRRRFSAFNIIEVFLQNNNNLMPIRYSYSDIKKMTRNFREKLGKGGYGSVYKGKIRSGHDVAVKTLSTTKENGQDFINEVATIGRIHHINVVKLVGYCVERSKRVLVYDLMSNGSLDKYIFNKQSCDSLSWERKYRIAIGVARGIEYLHKGCDVQILHFDIKPHNILLDENFIPKISDFGLAKFFSVEKNNVTLTAARGTIGYVAPELMNRSIGEVSYKADVYSFGMLLMEMIGLNTNKAPGDDKSSQYFPYWIYDRINKGKDNEIGNVVVVDDDDDEYAKKVTKIMTIVGLWCIQISPISRPSMSEVLKMLEGEDENLQLPPQLSEASQHECDNDQI